MFETRLGILVQTLIWETSKHGQRGAILLGGRELVRGFRGTRTFHLFHLFCKFPWIFAWFGFVGVALLVCLFLLAFAFGEICFLSSLIPVVDRQCLALVRQCRKKKMSPAVIQREYHSRWPQGRRGRREGWHALALVGPMWAMGGRKRKGGARCRGLPGPEQRKFVGWTTSKTERGGCVLQTALNGRPKAGGIEVRMV